jgi:hypothetical protein
MCTFSDILGRWQFLQHEVNYSRIEFSYSIVTTRGVERRMAKLTPVVRRVAEEKQVFPHGAAVYEVDNKNPVELAGLFEPLGLKFYFRQQKEAVEVPLRATRVSGGVDGLMGDLKYSQKDNGSYFELGDFSEPGGKCTKIFIKNQQKEKGTRSKLHCISLPWEGVYEMWSSGIQK